VGYIIGENWTIEREPVVATERVSNLLGSAAFSCSIGDWNPDWDVFIETSWRIDDEGNDIAPELYRDTELALTWDYFGFDKNLYQPAGYSDGIYLWNPRSWENEGDIHFTFKELVRMGTQYVLYPFISPNTYKIFIDNNLIEQITDLNHYYYNPGISVNLSTPTSNYFRHKDFYPEQAVFDINFEGEMMDNETTRIISGDYASSFTPYTSTY
jgi:hypothetical protein